MANGTYLCVGFSVVITFATAVFAREILALMKTPGDIFESAYIYIVIIFWGIPATMLYNMTSGIIRSLGDSKTPVIFLALSSGINIVLDIVLIYYVKMGVAGAAVATVVSQAVSGVGCLVFMRRRFDILRMNREEKRFDRQFAAILCGMGIPMGLQYSITAIGSVILQTAVNSLGTVYVASVTAGSKLSMFFCCPFDALGSTAEQKGLT